MRTSITFNFDDGYYVAGNDRKAMSVARMLDMINRLYKRGWKIKYNTSTDIDGSDKIYQVWMWKELDSDMLLRIGARRMQLENECRWAHQRGEDTIKRHAELKALADMLR